MFLLLVDTVHHAMRHLMLATAGPLIETLALGVVAMQAPQSQWCYRMCTLVCYVCYLSIAAAVSATVAPIPAVDETDLFVDNEQSISVNTGSMMQSLPAQLRLALAQQHHHHHHNQQHQHAAAAALPGAAAAGVLEGGSPVSAAAAAAAVSTMRKLVKKVSSRSREHGSSGGGGVSTPGAAMTSASGAFGGSVAAVRIRDSSLPVASSYDEQAQPLLSQDPASRS
jgi:hypothetical protein